MPTYTRSDGKPQVQFDLELELSPFVLFRRLKEGRPTLLLDTRSQPASQRTLSGAAPWPGPDWRPDSPEQEVVLFDEDGTECTEHVIRLRQAGYSRVRMLFGGLDLYEFSLDPKVVGDGTFLIDHQDGGV